MSSDVLVTLRCCSYSPFVLSLSKDVLTVPPAPQKNPRKTCHTQACPPLTNKRFPTHPRIADNSLMRTQYALPLSSLFSSPPIHLQTIQKLTEKRRILSMFVNLSA